MGWEDAWIRNRYEVGRAMHDGWKRQKIANGFADHPYVHHSMRGMHSCGRCWLPKDKHHADMIDWDALPPEQQAINFEGGREGFRLGFEARDQEQRP